MVDDLLTIINCGCQSVAANEFVMNKIEMMKLSCGEDKCKQIHVGNTRRGCPVLKVHGENMKKVSQEKYLGDTISEVITSINGSNHKNIAARKNKGIGSVAQIMTILNSASLGQFYFDMALILR